MTLRLPPVLRGRIREDARALGVPDSSRVRTILAERYFPENT